MARQCLWARWRPNPRDLLLLGFSLLVSPLACGSGTDEGADEQNDAPSGSDVEPRDARPAATDPEPSAVEDDEDDEDDAMPANPVATDPEDAADGSPAAPGASADSSGLPPAPAAAFASCTRREGSYGTNCDYVYVTMTQTSPERCVQLTIDNCGDSYSSPGLPVDTPLSWKLSSASIGSSPDECELGVFNPEGTIVVDASGSIDWDAVLPTALPTGIVLDVTLQPSSSADDISSIDVVTPEPLSPASCEE